MPQYSDRADLPFDLAMAIQEIYALYGDRVSIWDKRKTLIKFGRNTDVDQGRRKLSGTSVVTRPMSLLTR